jgi:hypothetical protein
MATERYGAEGTFISPGTWRGPQFAAEWRLYFTDEARYPVVTKSLHQTTGSTTSWTIEVYDNHGQHYSHMVQQSTPGAGFGCTFTTSFVPSGGMFRCVADKEFDKPLTPKLIDLVKTNNIQTCIKAAAAATLDAENMMAERDAYKAEVEALKAELAKVAAERDTIKAELATRSANADTTQKTAMMVASTVVVGILGLLAGSGAGTSIQSVMPPLLPMLSGPTDLD